MKILLRFCVEILWEAIKSFWKSIKMVKGMVGTIVFVGLIIGKLAEQKFPIMEWISSWWLLALIGVFCLYFLLKANYEKYHQLELAKDEEITDLHNTMDKEITNLHNTIDSVRDIKSRLFQFVGGVYSEGWQLEVTNYLRATMPQKYVKGFEEALSDQEPEQSAKAYLKGVADLVNGAIIRQARLS